MNLKKIGKLFTSKFVGTGPSSYEKRIYRAAVSQRLRNTGVGKDSLLISSANLQRLFSGWLSNVGAVFAPSCGSPCGLDLERCLPPLVAVHVV